MRTYTSRPRTVTRRQIPLDELPGPYDSLSDVERWHLTRQATFAGSLKEIAGINRVGYETIKRRDSEYDLASYIGPMEYIREKDVADIRPVGMPKVRRPGEPIPEDSVPTRLDWLRYVLDWHFVRSYHAAPSTSEAARRLGISRQEINRRVKRMGIRETKTEED